MKRRALAEEKAKSRKCAKRVDWLILRENMGLPMYILLPEAVVSLPQQCTASSRPLTRDEGERLKNTAPTPCPEWGYSGESSCAR